MFFLLLVNLTRLNDFKLFLVANNIMKHINERGKQREDASMHLLHSIQTS